MSGDTAYNLVMFGILLLAACGFVKLIEWIDQLCQWAQGQTCEHGNPTWCAKCQPDDKDVVA